MPTELIRHNGSNLPAEVSTEIRQLLTLRERYMETLPIEKAEDARPKNALMLSHIKRSLDRKDQIMILSMMISEVNDFFNVRGNMSTKQIKLTAQLILDNPNFYDLTLGNIKACFHQRMMSEKIYDRLDGNIIIGWLREFKSEMADHCETVKEGYDRIRQREESTRDAGAITHAAYIAMLETRANAGDKDAKKMIAEYHRWTRISSAGEQREKDLAFFKYKQEYLKQRGYYDKKTTEPENKTDCGPQHNRRR